MHDSTNTLKRFRTLGIDGETIGLSERENDSDYFCTPLGAEIVGWLGVDGIHFCFIPTVDKNMVFVVSPMPCGENHVEPVARNFLDFLSLIVCCRDSSPLEQISWMNEANFNNHLETEAESYIEGKAEVLSRIQSEFAVDTSIKPYSYVKSIRENFNYLAIPYSDEYYKLTGLDRLDK